MAKEERDEKWASEWAFKCACLPHSPWQLKGNWTWWRLLLTTVRVSLGCQLDWIWNQLSDKPLGTPVRISWILLFEVGRPPSNTDSMPSKGSQTKEGMRKKFCFLPACYPVAFLPQPVPYFTDPITQLLQFSNMNWSPVALQESSLEPRLEACNARLGQLRCPAWQAEQLPDSWPL